MKSNVLYRALGKLVLLSTLSYTSVSWGQLINYDTYYSQSQFSVAKVEDVVYGVGATNYYLYTGVGDENQRSNYNLVTQKELTLDLFVPDTSASQGKRAVLIMIPGSGRDACLIAGQCTVQTIRKNNISTATAYYLSQEGDNYNELNDVGNRALNFARRGFVVLSPNTRSRYHNRQYDNADANLWSRDDGTDLLNGSSTHLEPLVVDLRRVVRWLSDDPQMNQYNVDLDNIFILGSSGASKMASLATIVPNDKLLADNPAYLDSTDPNYQFEVDNNHLLVPQRPLRGAMMISGDTNGTRNLELMSSGVGDFLFWHGTKDTSILHGMAETIEEKCEFIGCKTQFYSLPNVGHGNAASQQYIYSTSRGSVSFSAHFYDFMVNVLKMDTIDARPTLAINPDKVAFEEQSGVASVELTLSEPLNNDLELVVAATQMREVTLENGDGGQLSYVESFVANDSNSFGPMMYDQSTGVIFEEASNVPNKYNGLTEHTSGPGQGNPILIDLNSDYFFDDFEGFQRLVTIPAGQTSLNVNVSLNDDTLLEQNECFKFRVLHAQGVNITNPVETITILDNENPSVGSSIPIICQNPDPQPSVPLITIKDKFTDEVADIAFVRVSSNQLVSQDIIISYNINEGSALLDEDYSFSRSQVTIKQGTDKAFIPVTIIDDTTVEADETLTVNLQSVVSGAANIIDEMAVVTIADNDVSSNASVSLSDKFVNESSNTAYIRASLDQVATDDVVLAYVVEDNTATSASNDFEVAQGEVTIRSGTDRVFIPVTIYEDTLVEGNETFTVRLTGVVSNNAMIVADQALVTIVDNDVADIPSLSVNAITVLESAGVANVVVSSDIPVSEDIVVSYQTNIGTADTSDYVGGLGQVTLLQGNQQVVIPIAITNDTNVEGNETFSVELLSVVSGTATIVNSLATVTIENDDVTANINVSISDKQLDESVDKGFVRVKSEQLATTDIVLSYVMEPGTASAAEGDYVSEQGQVIIQSGTDRAFIRVLVNDDTVVESTETLTIRLAEVVSNNATITDGESLVSIVDNDVAPTPNISIDDLSVSESAGVANVIVSSDIVVTEDIVLSYQTNIGIADASDFITVQGNVTIFQGSQQAEIPVTITNDSDVETNETFTLELLSVVSGSATIIDALASVTIENDDVTADINVSISDKELDEAVGKGFVRVRAEQLATEDIVLSYVIEPGTAAAVDGDYIAEQGQVTITAGSDRAFIRVLINEDTLVEPTETLFVRLTGVLSNNAVIVDNESLVTILDNDVAPEPNISINDLNVSESVGTANVIVMTDIAVAEDIVLSYRTNIGSADASDFTAVQGNATIVQGTQQVTIPVSITNDSNVETNETFTLELLSIVSGSAAIIDGLASVTIENDDAAPVPSISINDLSISESIGTANVVVSTDIIVVEDIVLSYQTNIGTADTSDFTAAQGSVTITQGSQQAVIPIAVSNDTAVEADEMFSIELLSVLNGTASIVDSQATVTIENDDVFIPTLSLEANLTIDEATGAANISLNADAVVAEDISVSLTTIDGTANSADYSLSQTQITIPQGAQQAIIPVVIQLDSVIEDNESFTLVIESVLSGSANLANTQTEITIKSDFDSDGTGDLSDLDDDNDGIPDSVELNNSVVVNQLLDDFETNTGWVINPNGTDTATTGQWGVSNPEATSHNGVSLQPENAASGLNALITEASAGSCVCSFDIDNGDTTAISPPISLPDGSDELSFNYYFGHLDNATNDDYLRVSIQVNGSQQAVFSQVGSSNNRNSVWTAATIDVSAYAGQTIRLFVEAADAGTPSLVEAGIDDFSVRAVNQVSQDIDNDGLINSFDLDSDNDGLADITEAGLIDSDNNFIVDNLSQQASINNPLDNDGDNLPNFIDAESNNMLNDGSNYDLTQTPYGAFDTNNDGMVNSLDVNAGFDNDRDGVDDLIDTNATQYGG